MNKDAKIFVAGHRGLVGSAIVRALKTAGYQSFLTRTRSELDLTHANQVADFFAHEKPDYVVLAAAKVGGIYANNQYPAEFIRENLLIQEHVIHQSYLNDVKRLLFLGSSCIYPKACRQPIREQDFMSGPLEPTNSPYAIAKIAGIEMCDAYNRQYGTQYLAAMPTNLYGPNDNYHPKNSHVIPALIRKFAQACQEESQSVEIWGSGQPKREFLHSDDLASACLMLLNLADDAYLPLLTQFDKPIINVGYGQDVTIERLSRLIQSISGFEGEIVFNSDYPDGTPRKIMDSSALLGLGFEPTVTLEEGLQQVYAWYWEHGIEQTV